MGLCVYMCMQPSPPGPIPIPGGGVPLNMREVEELERMTKDFIKDMDTHAPVITSPPTGTYTHHMHKQRGSCKIMVKLTLKFIAVSHWYVM